MRDIVFVCGARDFHAMDKYWLTVKAVYPRKVSLLTDLIESEGQPKLINEKSIVYHLFNIDCLLFNKQSSYGNKWRNLIKALAMPMQVFRLKKFFKRYPDNIFHAIPMYYMMLCYLAKIPFVGTPQGSEILVRPAKSKIYKWFAIRCLKAANTVIVDSVNMQNKVFELSGIRPVIMKNGFNTSAILKIPNPVNRNSILSIRGLNPNYRIQKIFEARKDAKQSWPISFAYPSSELDYKKKLEKLFIPEDRDLGFLKRDNLFREMSSALLVISIPISDSSPRSVYESIFAGACVAVTHSPYLDELPECMIKRIFIVDLDDSGWFESAINYAGKIIKVPFLPSEEALDLCDEERTIKKVIDKVYYHLNN